LSNAVAKTLLPQLLTSLRSTNASIRDSGLKAGLALLSRCHDVAGLKTISDLLMKTLKDGKRVIIQMLILERLVDTRVAVTKLLESMANDSTTVSSSVIQALQPLFAKETNDALLIGMIETFCAHISVLLQNNIPLEDKSLKLVVSGLADKRAKIKTAWTVATAEILTESDEPATADAPIVVFSKATAKPLFGVLSEVANNAVQATQTGTVIGGYAVITAALGKWMVWKNAPELGFPSPPTTI
jgi:Generalcontrol nonderepressible 1 (Gcn1) N-terminal